MVRIGPLAMAALPEAAAVTAALQRDPGHHIGYLGVDTDALAEQLRELEPLGLAGTIVARDDDGALLGLIGAEWDTEPPRVWWHGPLVGDGDDWDHLADQLYDAARELLPPEVLEEELAPDHRNARIEAFARRHGFHREVASAVLSRSLTDGPDPEARPAGEDRWTSGRLPADELAAAAMRLNDLTVEAMHDAYREAVAALHDRLFPGTHTFGVRIDDGERRIVLVARRTGGLVGYVAAEVEEDGDGYLDHLGVTPVARRQGIGGLLVVAVCDRLREAGSQRVHLTVREDNTAARRLYAALGFTQERLLVPWRLGFSVP